MVKADLIQFARKTAERCGATLDPGVITALEGCSITLPPTWDFFESGLASARENTAHARFLNWHRANFKNKKCGLSQDDCNNEREATRSCKRTPCSFEGSEL